MTQTASRANHALVAYCGLYCGNCAKYIRKKCPGCHENSKATWCKIRQCCRRLAYASCASCTTHADPMRCSFFNNFVSRLFALVFKSDRAACIAKIKESGIDTFAASMADNKRTVIRKS